LPNIRRIAGHPATDSHAAPSPRYAGAVTSTPSSVAAAWAAGRARWPQVELDRAALAAFVAALPDAAVARFPEDLFLACACSVGDDAALRVFEELLLPAAQAAIRSIDASPPFVDEATQRLRTHLLVGEPGARPRISAYAGRGSLRAWVGVSAARVALMMRRSSKRAKEIPEDDWTMAIGAASTGTPELDLLKQQHAAAFSTALRDAARNLEPRLRSVLRMHFVDELSIDEIGATYAVHRATAARWIQRARETLFASTRGMLAARLALSGTELDRLAALVQSQLDVSLSQLLPPEALAADPAAPLEPPADSSAEG
jgi:RNA polymerase sigma-70 factor (ECF subfamily)